MEIDRGRSTSDYLIRFESLTSYEKARTPPSFSLAELGFRGRRRDYEFYFFSLLAVVWMQDLGLWRARDGPGSDIGLNQFRVRTLEWDLLSGLD